MTGTIDVVTALNLRVGHGVKVVASAGTDEKLTKNSLIVKYLYIQAQTDNTSAVAVGGSGVDATVATGNGVLLYAGDTLTLLDVDLRLIYVDSLVNGEGVRYTYQY